jgi:hypothetical protein
MDLMIPGVIQMLGRLCSNLRHLDLKDYYMEECCNDDSEVLLSATKASLVSLKLGHFYDERRDGLHRLSCMAGWMRRLSLLCSKIAPI